MYPTMPKLNARKQYKTGSPQQVLSPHELKVGDFIQFDVIRKPIPVPARFARTVGAFLTSNELHDRRNRRERRRDDCCETGQELVTDGSFRGRVLYMGETALLLGMTGFDFHSPPQPMVPPPTTRQPETKQSRIMSNWLAEYSYDDLGLQPIRPGNSWWTNEDIGRYALAVVHRLQEPAGPTRQTQTDTKQ